MVESQISQQPELANNLSINLFKALADKDLQRCYMVEVNHLAPLTVAEHRGLFEDLEVVRLGKGLLETSSNIENAGKVFEYDTFLPDERLDSFLNKTKLAKFVRGAVRSSSQSEEDQEAPQPILKILLETPSKLTAETKDVIQNEIDELSSSRERLISGNLGLVITTARDYWAPHMTPLDFIQAGNVGLVKAVDGFKLSRGNTFSTYAVPAIKGEMSNSIRVARAGRVSPDDYKKIRNLNITEGALTQFYMREPSREELANEMGITVDELRDIIRTRRFTEGVISMTSTTNDEEERTIDLPDEEDFEEVALRNNSFREVEENFLSLLGPEQRKLAITVWGLNGEPTNVRDLAKRVKVNPRQLEKQLREAKKTIGMKMVSEGLDPRDRI